VYKQRVRARAEAGVRVDLPRTMRERAHLGTQKRTARR
jgi:hypothetical protein